MQCGGSARRRARGRWRRRRAVGAFGHRGIVKVREVGKVGKFGGHAAFFRGANLFAARIGLSNGRAHMRANIIVDYGAKRGSLNAQKFFGADLPHFDGGNAVLLYIIQATQICH